MTLTHYRFSTPKELNGRPFLEGFRILKLNNLTTSLGQVYIQIGYFDDTDTQKTSRLTPLDSYVIDLLGDEYASLIDTPPDSENFSTIGEQIMYLAYTAVIKHKTLAGEDWAGTFIRGE